LGVNLYHSEAVPSQFKPSKTRSCIYIEAVKDGLGLQILHVSDKDRVWRNRIGIAWKLPIAIGAFWLTFVGHNFFADRSDWHQMARSFINVLMIFNLRAVWDHYQRLTFAIDERLEINSRSIFIHYRINSIQNQEIFWEDVDTITPVTRFGIRFVRLSLNRGFIERRVARATNRVDAWWLRHTTNNTVSFINPSTYGTTQAELLELLTTYWNASKADPRVL
jgi:hypothetical protein